jgi:hypothetical protein
MILFGQNPDWSTALKNLSNPRWFMQTIFCLDKENITAEQLS